MKKILLVLLMICSAQMMHAQVGFSASYQSMDAKDFESHFAENISTTNVDKYFGSGYRFGVDYWFRLADRRIEFFPELSFSKFNNGPYTNPSTLETTGTNLSFLTFQLNTNLYLLDFEGDCNCPTFSKDGNVIKKGFFIQLSPGVSYASFQSDITNTDLIQFVVQNKQVLFSMGLGVGLDIGINDFITITPIARYNRHFNGTLGTGTTIPTEALTSNLDNIVVGLRLGFRFDEINKYGYR